IKLETINGAHRARSMTTSGTVLKKLPGRGIINRFQKSLSRFSGGILLSSHGNVHIFHSQRFNQRPFVWFGIFTQIDNCLYPKGSQVLVVFFLWLSTTVKPGIHLAEVFDSDRNGGGVRSRGLLGRGGCRQHENRNQSPQAMTVVPFSSDRCRRHLS